MKKSKEQYRKPPYTQKFKKSFSSKVCNFLGKILKKPPDKIEKFRQDSFAKNPDLACVYLAVFLAPKTVDFLIDMGNKGADLKLLGEVVYYCNCFSKHNKDVDVKEVNKKEVNKRVKDLLKKKKAIRGAVKLLCNLKPIPNFCLDTYSQDLNRELGAMQTQIKPLMDTYLKFMLFINVNNSETAKQIRRFLKEKGMTGEQLLKTQQKHIKQSTDLWNVWIVLLVDEFKRIGFSDRQAYKKTGEFLCIASHGIYTDNDPDRVRQRYTYHTHHNKLDK